MLLLVHTDTHTYRQTDRQTHRQTHRQTDRQIDTQTDRHTDRQTHRQTNTQTDRQCTLLGRDKLWSGCQLVKMVSQSKYPFINYTVSQKNDTDVAHYNFKAHQPILVIFGRDVAERVCCL